jgi:hypothetical protein
MIPQLIPHLGPRDAFVHVMLFLTRSCYPRRCKSAASRTTDPGLPPCAHLGLRILYRSPLLRPLPPLISPRLHPNAICAHAHRIRDEYEYKVCGRNWLIDSSKRTLVITANPDEAVPHSLVMAGRLHRSMSERMARGQRVGVASLDARFRASTTYEVGTRTPEHDCLVILKVAEQPSNEVAKH